MRVLVACEYSGRVREAFRARGHDAWSCDLLPSEDDSPHHMQGDVMGLFLGRPWDLMIAHPPCTHLAVSGARHFEAKRADGRQQEAIDFFLSLARAPVPMIAIENPVCIMSSVWRKPDQVIHPHMFGHPEFKATCLWLKGLPKLRATNQLQVPERGTDACKAWERIHRMSPGPDRWKERSRTFEEIANAFADQWGSLESEAWPSNPEPTRPNVSELGVHEVALP